MHSLRRRFATLFLNAYRADPRCFLTYVGYLCIWQAAPLVAALLVRLLVDGITDRRAGQAQVAAVLLAVLAVAGFAAARGRMRAVHLLVEKSTELYDRQIMRLSAEMTGVAHLENPRYLDRLEQLRYQPHALGQNGTQSAVVIWGTLQAGLVIAVLVTVHPALLLLLGFSVPSILAARRAERIRNAAFEVASAPRRHANHFFDLATSPNRADEVRTMGVRHLLLDRHRTAWTAADRRMTRAEVRAALIATLGRIVFAAGYVAAIYLVVDEGVAGRVSLGSVVLTVVLAGLLNQQVAVIIQATSQVLNALEMVDRYLWLVDHAAVDHAQRSSGDPPAVLADGLTLRGVSFRYPESGADVLRDLDLHLPAGTVVAVVGDNGTGKTTLVKLLTAMYRPTEGAITVDGVDLADVDPVRWRQRATAAFQDFARVELQLSEAVGIGDLQYVEDIPRVRTSLARGGAETLEDDLPAGLNTPLGDSFEDGAHLSGGQWQKVAVSRAMIRERPLLLVFDEPTANLDPTAERALFDRYAEQARQHRDRGAVTLLVSHRFSTVRAADLIVVLADGTIAESGTHDQLVAAAGTYAQLYELQAAGYR